MCIIVDTRHQKTQKQSPILLKTASKQKKGLIAAKNKARSAEKASETACTAQNPRQTAKTPCHSAKALNKGKKGEEAEKTPSQSKNAA